PEWYFLFLFQLLKYFPGDLEIVGTVVIPLVVMLILFILPLLGYGRMRKFAHFVGVVVVVGLLASVAGLTVLAVKGDNADEGLQKKTPHAEDLGKQAVQLARPRVDPNNPTGIPEEGAKSLLRRDPLTQGPELFQKNCATCHVRAEELANGKGSKAT